MAFELCTLNEDIFLQNFKQEYFLQKFIQDNIFDYSDALIVVLNDRKQVINFSVKFAELFNNKDINGENFFALMSEITHLPNDFFNEKSYFIKVDTNNKVYKAEISKYICDSVKSSRYVIILKDVSEHKEMKIEKDNFIATLTHDLKTPVRANILSLELLLKGRFGELQCEQTELLQEILNSNRFMMNMLDTLLTKYKYENEEVQLNKTVFNVNEFLEELIKELQSLFDEKNISCKTDLFNEDIEICADKLELKRAFSNLISNAIKFNKDNGSVEVSTEKCNDAVKIVITDTGIGMDSEKIKHIFDRYVSYAKKFRRLGTGLGLYVAQKIIQAHSGTIDVSSEVNKGSVFTVSIPVKK